MSNWRYGYCTINWGADIDLRQAMRQIKESGYAGAELQVTMDMVGEPNDFKRFMRDIGLEIAAFSAGAEFGTKSKDDWSDFKRKLDFCAQLGCTIFMVAGPWTEDREPDKALMPVIAENLERASEYAAKIGIKVAYHNHMGTICETEADIDKLMHATNALTFCFDTAHLALGGADVIKVINKYKERIGYIHLKDYEYRPSYFSYTEWKPEEFCELGEGKIGLDFGKILGVLKGLDYDDWIIVELDRATKRRPIESAEISLNYLKSILSQLPQN